MGLKHPIEILNGVMIRLETKWEQLSEPYTYTLQEEIARVKNCENIYPVKHLIQEDTYVEGILMDGQGDIVLYKHLQVYAQYTPQERILQINDFSEKWELVDYMKRYNYKDRGTQLHPVEISWYNILHNQNYAAMDTRLAKDFTYVPPLGKYGNIYIL